jgi:hypothetical protein
MTIILDGTPQAPPWTAEHYQVQKYGSRYYVDDKPPCALISDPHNEPVPGFSSLKPSKPFRKSVTIGDRKYTVPLDWYNAGDWFDKSDGDLSGADWWHAYYRSAKDAQNRNFARGHAIHRVAEAFLLGKPTNTETNADAQPYIPHLTEWIERNVTDVNAIEAVVFGYGYGGTGDAWVNVRGVSVYLDLEEQGRRQLARDLRRRDRPGWCVHLRPLLHPAVGRPSDSRACPAATRNVRTGALHPPGRHRGILVRPRRRQRVV